MLRPGLLTWLTRETCLLSQSFPVQGWRVQAWRGPKGSLEAREEQVLRICHCHHRDCAPAPGIAVAPLQSLGTAEGLLRATEIWSGGSTWCHQLSSWSVLARQDSVSLPLPPLGRLAWVQMAGPTCIFRWPRSFAVPGRKVSLAIMRHRW